MPIFEKMHHKSNKSVIKCRNYFILFGKIFNGHNIILTTITRSGIEFHEINSPFAKGASMSTGCMGESGAQF
jgi:hypothetical protein